jgi:diaminohydroxyphosphoribosylaminopyrimidine deaminase/5-amino-6-(5-phosphoribosylamino)uracil reductase
VSRRAIETESEQRRADEMMRRAIGLATRAQPHPNPRVGAVVVSEGRVVGEAAHMRAGEPHAEVLALQQAGEAAHGSTVYVTLEPCAHHGRTPPCSEALIAAGVSHVIVGTIDPDPRVSGAGVAALTEYGIQVTSGILADEVEAADAGYFHHRRTGLPRLTLKLASTLDGQIAAADGTSHWITSDEARRDGHRLRAGSDVVMVGAGTLLADDPRLDVRLPGYTGRQPRPVIIAGKRALPQTAKLYAGDPLVYAPQPLDLDLEHVVFAGGEGVDLGAAIKDLGARGYVDVMVEGGSKLANALIMGRHVDRIVLYLAAKLAGGLGVGLLAGEFATVADAIPLTVTSLGRVGPDIRVEAEVI